MVLDLQQDHQDLIVKMSQNNLFLDEISSIKKELDKIYVLNDTKSQDIQKIREIQGDLNLIEQNIKNTNFLDLFEQSVYQQLAIKNIVIRLSNLQQSSNLEIPKSLIKKIDTHYQKIIDFINRLKPFVIAFQNLENVVSTKSEKKRLKEFLRNIRIISNMVTENIKLIPLELLNGLRRICAATLDNTLISENSYQRSKIYEQDIKTYCCLIKDRIETYQEKLNVYTKDLIHNEALAWERENLLYDLTLEEIKQESNSATLEDDEEMDEIIDRLTSK